MGSPLGYVGSEKEPLMTQRRLDNPAYVKQVDDFFKNLPERRRIELQKAFMAHTELLKKRYRLQRNEYFDDEWMKSVNKQIKEAEQTIRGIGYPEYHPRRYQYRSVVLIDEVERASSALHNLFYRILDEGVLENSKGEKVNFRNSIIIVTSNIGKEDIVKFLRRQSGKEVTFGFIPSQLNSAVAGKSLDMKGLYQFCRKEAQKELSITFLNRFDKIIMARSLRREELGEILDLEIKRYLTELAKHRPLLLHIASGARKFLVDKAAKYPEEGARLLTRELGSIRDKVNTLLVSGQVEEGDEIEIKVQKGRLWFFKVHVRNDAQKILHAKINSPE